MQNDYISRKEAMEIIRRTSGDYAAAFAEVGGLSAADVRPVVHGKWLPGVERMYSRRNGFENIITKYKCSICGRTERDMEPFCNCGAMMGGNNDA